MAKTYRSRRAKGNRLEQDIAKRYTDLGNPARRMPMSGGMSGGFSRGDILKRYHDGIVDECKNTERHNLWDEWNQASEQAGQINMPALHISANNKPTLTVIRTKDYFDLLAQSEKYQSMNQE